MTGVVSDILELIQPEVGESSLDIGPIRVREDAADCLVVRFPRGPVN